MGSGSKEKPLQKCDVFMHVVEYRDTEQAWCCPMRFHWADSTNQGKGPGFM